MKFVSVIVLVLLLVPAVVLGADVLVATVEINQLVPGTDLTYTGHNLQVIEFELPNGRLLHPPLVVEGEKKKCIMQYDGELLVFVPVKVSSAIKVFIRNYQQSNLYKKLKNGGKT